MEGIVLGVLLCFAEYSLRALPLPQQSPIIRTLDKDNSRAWNHRSL